jgi:hypothetical protein
MKEIVFRARSKNDFKVYPKPYPASQNIPEWWRKEPPYIISKDNPDGKKFILENRIANASFKKCVPMLDAITSGYIVPLVADVQVRQLPDGPRITWRTHQPVFQAHGESSHNVVPPLGYSNKVFKYINTWIPVTPPGYSVIISAPIGHRNLPFQAIPAIIDSDKSTLEVVNPCWLQEGFEGIVEAGTPMFQITPFKRDSWKSSFEYYEDGQYYGEIEEKNFNSTLINHYIKKHWSKKTYK